MEETFGEIKAERRIRGVAEAEASDVREHLVAGDGPYLTLAEAQYCVSSGSTSLAVNLSFSLYKSVHSVPTV